MRNRLIKFIFIFTFVCYSLESLGCEYSCNQHGYCENGKCKCVPPWDGPDCSIQNCPTGFDWGGNHTEMVPCSGRGVCSQSICKCYDGFKGVACQILSCPTTSDGKVCSGHGRCLSSKQHSKLSFENWNCDGTTPAPKPKINYYLESDENGESWDANRIFGCECEGGYTGYDCSIKKCPLGAVNEKDKDDTTSYLVNPLKELGTINKVTKSGSSSVNLDIPAKWSLFIKNCEDSDDDKSGAICKAHNITVPCNITLIELRDVIRKDGIVDDIVIYSDNDCDRLSCKGDINYGITSTPPSGSNDYTLKFVFVVDKSAGLVQVSDEKQKDINGYCLGMSDSTPTPSNPSGSLLYTIAAPKSKMYMECSGLSKCTNGMCEKCNVEVEDQNSYLLKSPNIPFTPNVRNCQVRDNDDVNEDIYCNYGGIMDDRDENTKSHKHCVCNKNYKGHACDVRTCKDLKGTSFYSYAYENNKGHSREVCSGEGNCDGNGCNCRKGFVGQSCNKLSCGNKLASWMVSNPRSECSGRGECLVTSDYLPDYDGWDKNSIGICDCYDDFTGYNCEFRKCPYGPDPLDYYNCNRNNELPGAPYIEIYDTNKLTSITKLHFFSIDISQTINSINDLNNALLKTLKLEGPISYYKCSDGGSSTPKCSQSIELGDGTDGKWKKLSSTDTTFPIPNTHFRIYFHYYCVDDLRRQTIKPDKESYIKITAESDSSTKEFGINEGRLPCYECSNQGICDKLSGVCKCLGRYVSSSGVDENGEINVGRRGDCSYLTNYYHETEV